MRRRRRRPGARRRSAGLPGIVVGLVVLLALHLVGAASQTRDVVTHATQDLVAYTAPQLHAPADADATGWQEDSAPQVDEVTSASPLGHVDEHVSEACGALLQRATPLPSAPSPCVVGTLSSFHVAHALVGAAGPEIVHTTQTALALLGISRR